MKDKKKIMRSYRVEEELFEKVKKFAARNRMTVTDLIVEKFREEVE